MCIRDSDEHERRAGGHGPGELRVAAALAVPDLSLIHIWFAADLAVNLIILFAANALAKKATASKPAG